LNGRNRCEIKFVFVQEIVTKEICVIMISPCISRRGFGGGGRRERKREWWWLRGVWW